ncbi:MAG: DUF2889 domain-containing protein [Anaerolineae bacterium]|nr:DUF2889 domain-containing protein [Anaerolineae bacterium]
MALFTFPRTYTFEISPLDTRLVGVHCVLLDPYHHLEMDLVLDASNPEAMIVKEARASMARVPYPVCRSPLERVKELEGLRVERGIKRTVTRLLGGPEGCVHLVDMFMEGVRLAIQAVVVVWTEKLPQEEGEKLRRKILGGVCIAYPAPESP